MKSKTVIALAVAGTFASAAAFANSTGHYTSEVQTPASVSESAPWLAGQPHLGGWSSHLSMNSIGRMNSIGPERLSDAALDAAIPSASNGPVVATVEYVEYWLLGEAPADSSSPDISASLIMSDAGSVGYDALISSTVDYSSSGDAAFGAGVTSGIGGSGSIAFDSTMSGSSDEYSAVSSAFESSFGEPLAFAFTPNAETIADTLGATSPLVTEHYLFMGPLSSLEPASLIVLETGPAAEDVALMENLSRDFYVLTLIDPLSDA